MRERSIPNYLQADSKQELRALMGNLQKRTRLNINFYDFQKDGKKYVCWFDIGLSHEAELNLSEGGDTNG